MIGFLLIFGRGGGGAERSVRTFLMKNGYCEKENSCTDGVANYRFPRLQDSDRR